MKIGILVVATGKYTVFVPHLLRSVKDNFLTDHDVEMNVWTDSEELEGDFRKFHTAHEPWPYSTLMRYHFFTREAESLEKYDYLFYLDADMYVVGKVGDEVLSELTATQHPGFFFKPKSFFPYERRSLSKASVPYGRGTLYFCGGFNGGSKYLDMAFDIVKMVDADTENDIIPVWHDESYLNKYLIDHPPTKVLTPEYCFPDNKHKAISWGISMMRRKILALEKEYEEFRKV